MLRAHRRSHGIVWKVLALVLPLVLLAAVVLRPVPLEREPQRIDQTKAG